MVELCEFTKLDESIAIGIAIGIAIANNF